VAIRAARLGVIGAGLAAIVIIVASSLNRDAYFYYRFQDRARWEYPTGGVVLVAAVTAIETAIAYAVLAIKRPGRMWMRALAGLGVMVPWGWCVSEVIVHLPGFWIMHVLWVWLLIVVFGLAALVSAGLHAYSRLARQRT